MLHPKSTITLYNIVQCYTCNEAVHTSVLHVAVERECMLKPAVADSNIVVRGCVHTFGGRFSNLTRARVMMIVMMMIETKRACHASI